ncbi:hypothetical protein GW17_00061893 [Ensete ventricosum]|nr:hypothetical protein GW17_00061893 [Ensete ventricosum]
MGKSSDRDGCIGRGKKKGNSAGVINSDEAATEEEAVGDSMGATITVKEVAARLGNNEQGKEEGSDDKQAKQRPRRIMIVDGEWHHAWLDEVLLMVAQEDAGEMKSPRKKRHHGRGSVAKVVGETGSG